MAGKLWLAPAPSMAAVTVWVVETGQCSPMAPTSSISELKLWATKSAQRVDPGQPVADGVARSASRPPAFPPTAWKGRQQGHPHRQRAAVGEPGRQQRQDQHRAGALAVLQPVAEGDGAGGDGLGRPGPAVDDVRAACSAQPSVAGHTSR